MVSEKIPDVISSGTKLAYIKLYPDSNVVRGTKYRYKTDKFGITDIIDLPYDIYLNSVKRNGLNIQHVPLSYRDKNLLKEAVKQNRQAYDLLDDYSKDLYNQDYNARYFPNRVTTEESTGPPSTIQPSMEREGLRRVNHTTPGNVQQGIPVEDNLDRPFTIPSREGTRPRKLTFGQKFKNFFRDF